jgi:Carbohydrate esterase, sialic acid-specific acetylesterase
MIPVLMLFVGVALGVALLNRRDVGRILRAVGFDGRAARLPQETRASESAIPEAFRGKLRLFVLAGQSNMSGRGDIAQSGAETDPRIYVFGNDYRWKLATEPIDDPKGQVDKVSEDPNAGAGPALPFAVSLREQRPDMAIGLIPCAKGGTSIYQWRRSLSDRTLYGSCLKRMRAASTMGEVAGLLFFQGESDALDPKQYPDRTLLPNQWASEFAAYISEWRNDLGLPELPVVFAQIGSTTAPDQYKNWDIVKRQQQTVSLPFCAMITTDDLALKDSLHYTTESYRTIGQRFAEAYLGLMRGSLQ